MASGQQAWGDVQPPCAAPDRRGEQLTGYDGGKAEARDGVYTTVCAYVAERTEHNERVHAEVEPFRVIEDRNAAAVSVAFAIQISRR